ncbi:MarR family winged helix-turn-helix transcriptional regulator [Quisquiliibacterium transsilvanicum]|nr:MarR family transcriptional regulator [Quisquiliibacterium transsilvanicum]
MAPEPNCDAPAGGTIRAAEGFVGPARNAHCRQPQLTSAEYAATIRVSTFVDETDEMNPARSHDYEAGPARPDEERGPATANLKQLLLARNDWFAREIMNSVRLSSDFAFLTPAQSRLLALMAGKPMSMAELARRLAISRQAVHKTVAELARRGILELRDDPERGNSKLVFYTEAGRELNRAGARMIERVEERIAGQIGRKGLAQLKQLLSSDWD